MKAAMNYIYDWSVVEMYYTLYSLKTSLSHTWVSHKLRIVNNPFSQLYIDFISSDKLIFEVLHGSF